MAVLHKVLRSDAIVDHLLLRQKIGRVVLWFIVGYGTGSHVRSAAGRIIGITPFYNDKSHRPEPVGW